MLAVRKGSITVVASEATAAVAGVYDPDATLVVPLVTEEANSASHV